MIELCAGLMFFIVLAYLGLVLVLVTEAKPEEKALQLRLFFLAFLSRFILCIVIYQLGLVRVLGDEDASGWVRGVDLQGLWLRQGVTLWQLPAMLMGAFEGHDQGYLHLLGAVFFLTSAPYRLPAATLNAFFGALTVVLVRRTALRLFSRWVAAKVGWWACFFPSLMIWSAQTIKEPVVILLETAALYGCIRLRQLGPSPRHLALCIAAIVLLLPFRFYAAYIVGLAVLLSLLVRGLVPGRASITTMALIALLIPAAIGTGAFARHTAEVEQFSLNRAQFYRSYFSSADPNSGRNSSVQTGDIRTPSGFVLGTAVGAAHLLLAPFPWELRIGSLRMLCTFPELLYWWWLFFVGVIPGFRLAARRRLIDISPMLLVLAGLGLLYSMTFGNIGLVFRQRAQLLPWLLILGAVGLEQREVRRRGLVAPGAIGNPGASALRTVRYTPPGHGAPRGELDGNRFHQARGLG
jgi:hypothetical protein